jgi:hypothetical protein
MALYLVKARPKKDRLDSLLKELSSGVISKMRPFGSLQYSLENARIDCDIASWIEEDYCSPPLAMEREAVLDRYFDDTTVEKVRSEEEGWKTIADKPMLWEGHFRSASKC